MDIASVIYAFTLIFYASSRPSDYIEPNSKLKLVHVIFRHGARTPADTFPTDIHINNTMEPYGWGELTNQGKMQMYELGSFLRNRYRSYLGSLYRLSDVHAQSTGVSRAKMSLQLVLAGLYPPKGTALEWNHRVNWQPFDIKYQNLNEDSLLLVRKSCPRYHEELERVLTVDASDEIAANRELMEYLSLQTGLKVNTPDDVQSIFSTLKAENDIGLKLPEWTNNYYPSKMLELTTLSYVYNAYNSELKRLKGGVFVKKSIEDWQAKIDEKLKTKIFLYAGHDSTVTNILSAMNVWPKQLPDYGITAILEMSEQNSTLGIEVFLKNATGIHKLTIPGCDEFCPLNDLKTALKLNIPENWEKECISKDENFTEPPASGP